MADEAPGDSRWIRLGHDLAAGATVGLVSLPQAVAFALVAGVPQEVALLTMIVPGLVAGFFRDSPHLASGATNTAALLVGGVLATSPLVREHGQVAVLSTLCLIVGVVKLGVGYAGLGRLSRYVSPAVVRGFTLGAGALLALGQLPGALGLPAGGAGGHAIGHGARILRDLPQVEPRSLALAAASVLAIVAVRRLDPRLPGALFALIGGALACAALGWGEAQGVARLGEVPRSLPLPGLPFGDPGALRQLFAPALALALVGMTEVVSIGKSIEAVTGHRLRADQELRAQGFANLASSFFPCLPSSVSWSRSAVSVEAGASTGASVVFASLTVLAATLIAGPWLRFVPLPCVAGVVLWIAWRMVFPEALEAPLRPGPAERAVLAATVLATLLLPLEVAVFVGVFLSLGLVIRRASLLRLSELVRADAGWWRERSLDADTGALPIAVLQAEGDLFFGVAEELEDRLGAVAARGARAIVLRLRRTHALDGAAAAALARVALRLQREGGVLLLCGLAPDLRASLDRSGLGEILGGDAIYETGGRPFAALERSLDAARRHVGASVGAASVRRAEEPAGDAAFEI